MKKNTEANSSPGFVLSDSQSEKLLSVSMNVSFPAAKSSSPMPSLYSTKEKLEQPKNPFVMIVQKQFGQTEDELKKPPTTFKDIEITESPYDQQRIQYLYSLFYTGTPSKQCVPYQGYMIDYYSKNDITLGQFLEQYCFNPSLECKIEACNKSMIDHEKTFIHRNGRVNISICKAEDRVKLLERQSILMWSFCKHCGLVTPSMPMSQG